MTTPAIATPDDDEPPRRPHLKRTLRQIVRDRMQDAIANPANSEAATFINVTAGRLVLAAIERAGVEVETTFTADTDSTGEPWPDRIPVIRLPPGSNVLALLRDLDRHKLAGAKIDKHGRVHLWARGRHLAAVNGRAMVADTLGELDGVPITGADEQDATDPVEIEGTFGELFHLATERSGQRVHVDFTAAHDSDGRPWTGRHRLKIGPGATLGQLARQIQSRRAVRVSERVVDGDAVISAYNPPAAGFGPQAAGAGIDLDSGNGVSIYATDGHRSVHLDAVTGDAWFDGNVTVAGTVEIHGSESLLIHGDVTLEGDFDGGDMVMTGGSFIGGTFETTSGMVIGGAVVDIEFGGGASISAAGSGIAYTSPATHEFIGDVVMDAVLLVSGAAQVDGNLVASAALAHNGSTAGFYGATPIAKQSLTAEVLGTGALARAIRDIATKGANLGLWTNNIT